MFERFTREARAVVETAAIEAERLHADQIGPEHLLLGLGSELRGLGVDPDELHREVAALDGLDADALATLGIDLDVVRRQAEETFGPGALDRPSAARRPRFGKAAKRALERTLREALVLGHRELGPAHILLALTHDARATELLARHGLEPDAVRATVLEGFGAAQH